jgi:hypothetical protein
MKKIAVFVLTVLLLASCTNSRITTVWKAPDVLPKKYQKILVTGLIKDTDRSIREKMENHIVGDLRALGCTAVSALAEYGPSAFDGMDEKAVLQKLQSSGVDAVLTIVLLDKEKERNYGPVRPYQSRFWGYYGRYNRLITEKDYYVINTKYFWESNFYEMSNGQLLYSVQTRSFDPASSESMGHEYGKLIMKDIVEKNILKVEMPK